MLKDGFFAGVNGTALIGAESSAHWQAEMAREASRVGLPVVKAKKGDLFCAYKSPQTLISLIETHTKAQLLQVV